MWYDDGNEIEKIHGIIFHFISRQFWKKKKNALKSEASQMIERKTKNETGEVRRERQSYDVRGDMVEGIKGWNI